ncbi:hypothetical protein ACFWBF_34145 [Streptomyces sp. NPDC060028]|uniref:hypothetical protein n=1 Tax=Streptomyces sp. NPDC060028 TaxID=3347041 RepID=UPI0036CFF33A
MIRETVVWTLLPDPEAPQSADGNAHLSLMFGIQLSTDQADAGGTAVLPLSSYPRVLDWPSFAFDLGVRFRKPGGETATTSATVEAVPQPALWRALFPSSTPVTSYAFDRTVSTDPLQSYPSHLVSRSLREEYGRLFAAIDGTGTRYPSTVNRCGQTVLPRDWDTVDRLIRLVGADQGLSRAHPVTSALEEGVLPDDFAQDPDGWLRLADFHLPFAAPSGEGEENEPHELRMPERDFHGILAALADHPGLMALIGLVRRVKVPLAAGLDGPVTLQAVPRNALFIRNDLPFTQCIVREGRLLLGRRNGSAAALHLPLDDTGKYTAVDVDVDAGGLALQSYAGMLAGLPRTEKPPAVRAPALRSDGISVTEANRQIDFRENLHKAAAMADDLEEAEEPGLAITMHADNVQLGYRVDVFDEKSGRWYPLCRRTGSYTVSGFAGRLPIDDEGTVTDAITRGVDPQGRRVSRLHQSLFRWSGWSLVAELPGKMLDAAEQLQDPAPAVQPNLPFSSTVRPPDGTLPSLRYGRSYRFRARLVDLAGRSLPFTSRPTAGEPATAPLRYSRYEPVTAPVLVPRRPVTPGESATVLVVRTNNANPAAPVPGPTCERHLLASKAAVQLLERHGVLDVAALHRLDPAVHALLTRLDGGAVKGQADPGAGGTPYIDIDRMDLPWLPDPLSRGAALHGLPGMPELLAEWPRGSGWHERFPLRLVVAPGASSGAQPPVIDPAARLIRVTLPPGASITTLLGTMLSPGDEELLGLWHWFAESGGRSADEIDESRSHAVAGRIAQLTPTTKLRMIHAVRCPVVGPAFGQPRVERAPGETAYVLADPAVAIHEPSTLSVHTEATWNETVDDLTQKKAPSTSVGRAVLHEGEEGLHSDADGPAVGAAAATTPVRARHDMGDTRHRTVRFTPVATSRFVSYFTERGRVRLTGTAPAAVASAFVPGTVVVRGVVDPLTAAGRPADPGPDHYSPDRDYSVDHGSGTISRMDGGAIPDGASVEVSFVVPPVTRAGSPVTLHVPATARPPAPAVHSVVPAFQWQDESTGAAKVSTRQGGIVRVYLQRPWYASGEGELLAVLVMAEGAQPDSTAEKWATMWGRDPVRQPGDAPLIGFPRPSDLLRAVVDVPVGSVHALGYAVLYDETRQLWYADVAFQGQRVYQPFVRLRVARLQPDALRTPEDLRLSPGVDAGFIQIPALRKASVTVSGQTATVTVTGPVPPAGMANISSRIIVSVQIRGNSSIDDPAQWATVGTPATGPTTTTLPLVESTGPLARWTGTVPLPVLPPRPQRLLIQEVDEISGPDAEPIRRISYLDTITV